MFKDNALIYPGSKLGIEYRATMMTTETTYGSYVGVEDGCLHISQANGYHTWIPCEHIVRYWLV